MMSMSWTASSQITGISKEQKKEIVFALQDYPLVKKERDSLLVMNKRYFNIIERYESVDGLQEDKIRNLNKIIDNTEKQLELTERQLKAANKNSGWLHVAGGIAVGVGISAVLLSL